MQAQDRSTDQDTIKNVSKDENIRYLKEKLEKSEKKNVELQNLIEKNNEEMDKMKMMVEKQKRIIEVGKTMLKKSYETTALVRGQARYAKQKMWSELRRTFKDKEDAENEYQRILGSILDAYESDRKEIEILLNGLLGN